MLNYEHVTNHWIKVGIENSATPFTKWRLSWFPRRMVMRSCTGWSPKSKNASLWKMKWRIIKRFSNVQAVFPQIIELIEVEIRCNICSFSFGVLFQPLRKNKQRRVSKTIRDTCLSVPLLETDFVEKHQGHGLDRVVTTIYVVPQEQIVGPWGANKNLKKRNKPILPQFFEKLTCRTWFLWFFLNVFFF